MKRYAWLILVSLLLAVTGFAQQEDREKSRSHDNLEAKFDQEQRERDFRGPRRDMGFQQRLMEIERRKELIDLGKKQMDQPGTPPPPPMCGMNGPLAQQMGNPPSCPMMGGQNKPGNCPMGKCGNPRMMVAKKCHQVFGIFMLLALIIHILLAIWVYQDIRKRNSESGIWIVIALLAGLLGTAVYALVRLGDTKK